MILTFVFIVCLTASASASPHKVKVNRKGGSSVKPASEEHFGWSDHVISGSNSNKQNAANHPPIKVTDPPEIVPNFVLDFERNHHNLPPKRRTQKETETEMETFETGNDVGSSVEWLSPLSPEGSKVLAVLTDVSENLASLRDVLSSLKYQNQLLSRQMKRFQTKSCGKFTWNNRQLGSNDDRQSPQQDEANRKLSDDVIVRDNIPWFPVGLGGGALIASSSATDQVERQRPTAGATKAKCPPQFNYSVETERCYQLSGDRMVWKTARERCRWAKAGLVSIDSNKEQKVVNEMARANPGTQHCDFWIGLTRQGQMSTHDWYWEKDGHLPSYTNWNEDEPNNGNGHENCAQMLWVFNWKWNDAPCSHGNACFICETRPQDDP